MIIFKFATKNIIEMQRAVFLILFQLIFLSVGYAQQQVLVCDAATGFPLRDVETYADSAHIGKTTYLGIIHLPDSFRTATFRRKGFLSETLTREEVLSDTVFLYAAEHYLDEVIVMGKKTINGAELLKRMPKRDILEKATPGALGAFDFGKTIDFRYQRDKRHVKKNREIFKKLDELDDPDPIMRAYKATLLKQKTAQQQKNEREQ